MITQDLKHGIFYIKLVSLRTQRENIEGERGIEDRN